MTFRKSKRWTPKTPYCISTEGSCQSHDMDGVSLVQPPTPPVRPVCHYHLASASEPVVEASQDGDNNIIDTKVNNREPWKLSTIKNNVHLRFGIDHTREPRNYNCHAAVESDGYQTTTALFNNLSASALVAPSSPIIRDGSLTIPRGLSFLALRRYYCATQRRTSGNTRIRIGDQGSIPRWIKGSILKYVVCTESFEKTDIAEFVAAKAAEAISTWKGIGVKFKQVERSHAATFQIKYCHIPSDCDPNVYADAFLPRDGPGTLFVYEVALKRNNKVHLGNILAHEFGHILGLRHEFAGDPISEGSNATREDESVLWGSKNESSVMNYYTCPGMHQVNEQDLRELESFYNCTEKEYKGLKIRDFQPTAFWFPSEEKYHTRWGLSWLFEKARASYLAFASEWDMQKNETKVTEPRD
ncbi:hypothetical protein GGR58DRAFT_520810 [Xylaria digitata]|nr:hypothetical protein GGR58DRAFT_520810 [Xylaria digitata]